MEVLPLTLLLLASLVPPSLASTAFLFGDSLVDAGNNHYLLFTLSKADSPPYGIDFKPSRGHPTGRFTNGRTIADIVGQALGGKLFPPPFLGPQGNDPKAILGGINYASGSAGILDETGSLFIERIPLREQVNYFQQSRAFMVNLMGENGTNDLLKKAIFSLTIGSNDILNYIQPSIPIIQGNQKISPSLFLDSMVSNLTLQLKRLRALGARKMVVVGVGPLGCIPFVRALNFISDGECYLRANRLIQTYNSKLKFAIKKLNREMGSGTAMVYADSYQIFTKILTDYRRYGFENAREPCCGGYFPPLVCYNAGNKNTTWGLCEDRTKYVFWDAFHPTEAANLVVAKHLLDGDHTVVTPFNIRTLDKL